MAVPSASDRREPAFSLSTRQLATAGVLGGIAILLGVTPLGFIPVPNLAQNATIMHVPAILGAVLEGPAVGVLTGGIFGVFSWLRAENAIFKDPLVAIGPRVVIGLVAWLVFALLRGRSILLASVVAGVLGSAANTVGVLGLAVALGYLSPALLVPILPQAVAEAVIAAVVTAVVVRQVLAYRSGKAAAPELAAGEQRRY